MLHLRELEQFSNVKIVETPIPQGDVAGNRQIRSQIRFPIAMHFGSPPIMTALADDVCDGFVIGGGVKSVLDQATIAAQANKPFWLQLVGTGLTTAWAMQLGAVCTHAQWPAVTCMHIYSDDLLAEPLQVVAGYVRVSQEPGLGVEVDEDALAKYRPGQLRPGQAALPAALCHDLGLGGRHARPHRHGGRRRERPAP